MDKSKRARIERGKLSINMRRLFSLIVIFLFLTMPVSFALQISNTGSSNISDTSATIIWTTDETSDSAIHYGIGTESLELVETNSDNVLDHEIEIVGLNPETEYFYYVESENINETIIDDNSGSYYSFTTEASSEEETSTTDSTASTDFMDSSESEETVETEGTASIGLSVEHEDYVGSEYIDISVTAADETDLRVYVNGGYFSSDEISAESSGSGTITFRDVPLNKDQSNDIMVEATLGDLIETYAGTVYSDLTHPEITLQDLSEYIEETTVEVIGKVSEEGILSIDVNGQSVLSDSEISGTTFTQSVNLEEGSNTIVVTFTDLGGLSDQETIEIVSDTEDPQVEATLSKGNEYYQNRAETDISGTTEAGATVYLYVYRPQTWDYEPSFDDPWQVVEADESGEFTFTSVDFENEPITLEDFEPIEVPAGLEEVTINGVASVASQEEYTYHVYIIAEDVSGKTGYFKEVVTVNSCYSQSLDFQITDVAKYQAPLRLDPTLMDDGREIISSVFTLEYRGDGTAQTDLATGEVEEAAFSITSVRFEKACTQSMLEDEDFALGCSIMGSGPTEQLYNNDRTSHYLTWNLHPSEDMSDRDEDFWNDMQKRQVVFPIKVSVTYQELDETGNKGESKTQTSCYDLAYMVDVPIDSAEMIPDWLAEGGVDALNVTIDKIDKVIPYLEKAIMVTGIACVASFGGKIAMRFARIASSNLEFIKGKAQQLSEDPLFCPDAIAQNELYLQSTIDEWRDSDLASVAGSGVEDVLAKVDDSYVNDGEGNIMILDDRCQTTAGLWKTEATLQMAYKWTCDRVFCRAVPAKWTEFEDVEDIKNVVLEQQQCSVTGSCIPLREQENCREYVEDKRKELTVAEQLPEEIQVSGGTCWWRDSDAALVGTKIVSDLYYVKEEDLDNNGVSDHIVDKDNGVYKLTRIGESFTGLDSLSTKEIYVIQEENGGYCGARGESCSSVCSKSKDGDFSAFGEGYKTDYSSGTGILQTFTVNNSEGGDGSIINSGGGCFKEEGNNLIGPNGEQLTEGMFAAGYTSDCFVDDDGARYQCVCERDESDGISKTLGARTAIKTQSAEETGTDVIREKYVYRQDRVYQDSKGIYGTYYPENRYYAGRDVQGAFGANYLLDYLRPENKKQTTVDPFTQHIGAFQSVCLSGIRSRLVLLRNILDGLRQCIIEAKYTGLQDAGMCKTIFTQHVCGLVYKAISYFASDCTPYGFSDTQKTGGFGEQIKAITSGFDDATQSSIDDLYADYDNAAFDNYFGAGTQGFVQSMCLFAFGYDFPLGVDFIQDAAYSVAMKTSSLVTPATREFSSYNPKDMTTIYNYEIGAVVFAGCRVNNYNVYLKCVGSEDYGAPGVDTSCGGEGCDCLNIETDTYASSRVYHLETGHSFEAGEVIDIPIESPQKIDSPYRYDHVVIEVDLDPNEDPEKCFDVGYRTDTGGIFYHPIRDISPGGVASCQVETLTGRYMCPDIGDLFYGEEGFAYLESPYIECQDPSTGEFESCGTPNMLVLNEGHKDIIVKPYIYTDGAGYCMKIKVTGSGSDYGTNYVEIPEGVMGTLAPSIDVGEITSEMFGEYSNDLNLNTGSSNSGCEELDITSTPTSASSGSITFDYKVEVGESGYKVKLPDDVSVESSGYDEKNDHLVRDGETESFIELDEINKIKFSYDGFEFTNILGNANTAGTTLCKYNVQVKSSSSSSRNEASIGVEVALLQRPDSGSCQNAKTPVEDTALGASSKRVSIVIQKDKTAVASSSDIYDEFEGKDYDDVISMATNLITESPNTLNEAVGIYYYVASLIMMGESSWEQDYGSQIENMLNRFFLRKDVDGDPLSQFDSGVSDNAEYQSMKAYLCVIADELGKSGDYDCSGVSGVSGSSGSGSSCLDHSGSPLCGEANPSQYCGFNDAFSIPSDWEQYGCKASSTGCYSYLEYSESGYSMGCPGSELCCPP